MGNLLETLGMGIWQERSGEERKEEKIWETHFVCWEMNLHF